MNKWTRIAVLVFVPALLLAACGDDDDGDDAAAAEGEAVDACNARDDLADSVATLRAVDPVKDGTTAARTAFEEVRVDLENLLLVAREDVATEAGAVQASLDALDMATDAAKMSGQSKTVDVATVSQAVTDLAIAVDAFGKAVAETCP